MTSKSYVSHLECSKCNKTYEPEQVSQLCACGAPLLVRYDLKRLKGAFGKRDLLNRPSSLWRYKELLPVRREENIITLGEGMTPLDPAPRSWHPAGMMSLYMKDEGTIPTGTFKARGAAVGVSKAKELGVKALAMPTNGNAGGAWALYCARAGIKCYIVMPEDAPALPRNECAMSGAELYLVRGLISDAGKIIGRAVKRHGWYDASTLKEPYRIEGKKTMGFEIAEQLDWHVPDVILYPTGEGWGSLAFTKGSSNCRRWAGSGKRCPGWLRSRPTGCAPIVKAWEEKKPESEFWQNSTPSPSASMFRKPLAIFWF